MADNFPTIEFPASIVTLQHPLPYFRQALCGSGPVQIVAMGSSSTAGLDHVVPYPARLELYLRKHFRDHDAHGSIRIDVFNRGRGGEEAPEELARFQTDIFQDNPALVIWQVGTNAVFHKEEYKVADVMAAIKEGLDRLSGHNFDVLLIDPQYTTAMLTDDRRARSEEIVRLIRAAAEDAGVNLFQRWALMQYWHKHNNVSLEQLVAPDDGSKLHQSDWSTMQVSRALRAAIIKAIGLTSSTGCDCWITTEGNVSSTHPAPADPA